MQKSKATNEKIIDRAAEMLARIFIAQINGSQTNTNGEVINKSDSQKFNRYASIEVPSAGTMDVLRHGTSIGSKDIHAKKC